MLNFQPEFVTAHSIILNWNFLQLFVNSQRMWYFCILICQNISGQLEQYFEAHTCAISLAFTVVPPSYLYMVMALSEIYFGYLESIWISLQNKQTFESKD